MTPTAALVFCRFAGDASALLLWGTCAYVAWLVPRGLAAAVADRLRPWIGSAVVAAVGATLAVLPIEAASIGDGWSDALDQAVIGAVLTGTSDGQAWAMQAVAAALLVAFRFVPTRAMLGGMAGAAALWLLGLTFAGHAVMDEGWLGVFHRGNDALHVLTAGAWFGALVPVLLILPRLAQPEDRSSAALALRRFSRAGHAAVAFVLLTGAANAALVLGRWPTDLASPYEALLNLKVLVVLAMVGLALLNRYVLLPRLPSSLSALRRATLAELPLGLAAITLVAVFGLLDPN